MAYTYANFKTYLKLRFGNNDALDESTDYYKVWINAAYRMLSERDAIAGKRKIYFPTLETSTDLTTSDGVAYVSVPSDCLAIREIFDETSNVRLDWISYPDYLYKADRDTAASEDAPTYWTRRGTYVYLYPTPDTTYTLRTYYRKRPTALSATTDTSSLGEEWDDVILELATFIGRNWMGEPEKAEYARKLADEMIVNIVGLYDSEEKARREKTRPETWMTERNSY